MRCLIAVVCGVVVAWIAWYGGLVIALGVIAAMIVINGGDSRGEFFKTKS